MFSGCKTSVPNLHSDTIRGNRESQSLLNSSYWLAPGSHECTHSVRVSDGPSGGMAVNLKSMPACGVQSTVRVNPVQAHTAGHWARTGEDSRERDSVATRSPANLIFTDLWFCFCLGRFQRCLGAGLDSFQNSSSNY